MVIIIDIFLSNSRRPIKPVLNSPTPPSIGGVECNAIKAERHFHIQLRLLFLCV